MSREDDLRRRTIILLRIAVGIAVSAGLGWLAARGLDWGLVAEAFGSVSLPLVALAVAVFMAASYLRAARWKVLFVDDDISTNRLFVIQNVGIGLNNVVPVRIASEVSQLAILSLKDGIRPSVALATLGMERVLDVVASTLILAIAFFFVPEMAEFSPYVWGALGLSIVCIALVRFFAWGNKGIPWLDRIPGFTAFTTAVRDLERHPIRLTVSMIMSVGYWLAVGVTAWILANAIDLPITVTTATLVIMGTIFFATAVPAAPAAIGTFEFAVVYVLEFFGVSRESGFGFAVITHAVFFLPPTIMAAMFLPREGIGSFSRLRSLMAARAHGTSDAA